MSEEDPHAKIIRLVTEHYIDETEATLKELRAKVAFEQSKNTVIKDMAEYLARELLKFAPKDEVAEKALTLLLETKMKGEDPPRRGKKK